MSDETVPLPGEEFDSRSLPHRLARVARALGGLAEDAGQLTTLASEYAEALDVGDQLQGVAEDRLEELKREYDALQTRYQVGRQAWDIMNQRLAAAEAKLAAFDASRSAVASRLRDAYARAAAAEETALLLAEALCSTLS